MKARIPIALILSITFGLIYTSPHLNALEDKGTPIPEKGVCYDVELIFARGAGEELNASNKKSVRDSFKDHLKNTSISINTYEVGSENLYGHRYPAVAVAGDSRMNGLGAFVSGGRWFAYGDSIHEGKEELISYLGMRHEACHNTRFVVSGYSEGANVVGEAIEGLGNDDILNHVDFIALFGDPKLSLPEGGWPHADACEGKNLSLWRRKTPSCHTRGGALGARDPYFTSITKDRVGIWCRDHDNVCDALNMADGAGHMQYADDPLPEINAAMTEAVKRVGYGLPPAKSNEITQPKEDIIDVLIYIAPELCGNDYHRTTNDEYIVEAIHAQMNAKNVRFKVLSNTDEHSYTFNTLVGFIEDKSQLLANPFVSDIPPGGGVSMCKDAGDVNQVDRDIAQYVRWDQGATRKIVYIKTYPEQVASMPSDIDVVQPNLYLDKVDPRYIGRNYLDLQVNMGKFIAQNIIDIDTARQHPELFKIPTASLPLPNYDIRVGHSIHFDASKSEVPGPNTASYLWDFDANGTFDQTTTSPVLDHMYTAPFDGKMILRVQSSNGLYDDTSALVRVNNEPYGGVLPAAPTGLKATFVSSTSVRIDWSAGDSTPVSAWEISLDNFPLGYTKSDQRYVTLNDLRAGQSTAVRVAGRNVANLPGPAAILTFSLNDGSLKIESSRIESVSGSASSNNVGSGTAGTVQQLDQGLQSGATQQSTSTSSMTGQKSTNTTSKSTNPLSPVLFAIIGAVIALIGFGIYKFVQVKRRH